MDEVPKYRKKAVKKTPKKADHKHSYTDCVVEYSISFPWEQHTTQKEIRSYCPVCGKLGYMMHRENWMTESRTKYGAILVEWSDAAEAEFCDETRKIPYFFLTNRWGQKFVDI